MGDAELELCQEYAERLALAVLHEVGEGTELMTDSERRKELEEMGKWIGYASGASFNCLIHSILQILVYEINFSLQIGFFSFHHEMMCFKKVDFQSFHKNFYSVPEIILKMHLEF